MQVVSDDPYSPSDLRMNIASDSAELFTPDSRQRTPARVNTLRRSIGLPIRTLVHDIPNHIRIPKSGDEPMSN